MAGSFVAGAIAIALDVTVYVAGGASNVLNVLVFVDGSTSNLVKGHIGFCRFRDIVHPDVHVCLHQG
jgi:hypothetical protein